MATAIIMPKLGLTMTEGRLVRWLVEVGAEVEKGQPVAEIETEKIVTQVEAPAQGVLGAITLPAGEAAPVAAVIAWLVAPGEAVPEQATPPGEPPAGGEPPAAGEPPAGSEPAGGSPPLPLTGPRRIIAERMAASHSTTAAVTLFTETDATRLVEWRELLKVEAARRGIEPPSYNVLLLRILAVVLSEFPYMNASLTALATNQVSAGKPGSWPANVGLAVDTPRGLLVPVVRDADRKGVWEIASELERLVTGAREGTISPDDLRGGTCTLTNLGMYGVDGFTPIINLPECAIVGVGRIVAKPAVHEGQIAVRQCLVLSLTFDHRLVDGAPAARFLQRIAQYVEGRGEAFGEPQAQDGVAIPSPNASPLQPQE